MKILTYLILVLGIIRGSCSEASYVRNWLICGPFTGFRLEDKIVENEADISPSSGDMLSGKAWKEFHSVEDIINFEEPVAFGAEDEAVAYAYCEISSDEERTVLLNIGSDDGIKIWVNGENVVDNNIARGLREQDVVTARLKKGKNRFLAKVSDNYGGWGFYCNISGKNGEEIESLEFVPKGLPLERAITETIEVTSVQNNDRERFSPLYVIDDDLNTRWSSSHSDPQKITLGFKETESIKRIDLLWENAYAKSYSINMSIDGKTWKEIYSTDSGTGGHEIILLEKETAASFLMLNGIEKGTEWGYSLFELKVFSFKKTEKKIPYKDSIGLARIVWPEPLEVKKVTVSTTQPPFVEKDEFFDKAFICDNNMETRWGSEHADPQWIQLDFGKEVKIKVIKLIWESAYAKEFELEISKNAREWEQIHSVKDKKDDSIDEINLQEYKTARYLRLIGKERGTEWGYSLWEIQVFGESN